MRTIGTRVETGEHAAGRPGPCDEQEIEAALDHLHTGATTLAGDASRAGDKDAPAPRIPLRHRITRAPLARLIALPAVAALAALLPVAPAAAQAASANSVTALGGAPDLGPSPGLAASKPLLGLVPTPSGGGYWLVGGDGGVFTYGDASFFGSTGWLPLAAPIVGLAATPSGEGYWLVARDGGVFSFGDASFEGSLGGLPLAAPVVGVVAAPTGSGYWLVAADGGVFAFGDAEFHGSAAGAPLAGSVVGMAATPSGDGYWLVARDGGVFAFGDAEFHGSRPDPAAADAVGIGADPAGRGYWVARANGVIEAHGVPYVGDVAAADAAAVTNPTVGIAVRPGGGLWTVQGEAPKPRVDHNHPFLVCTRRHESSHTPPYYDDGYGAVNPSGTYRGAYQFSRSTWNSTASHAGRPDLVGVDPAAASVEDQDILALHLYRWQGAGPWLGRCAGL